MNRVPSHPLPANVLAVGHISIILIATSGTDFDEDFTCVQCQHFQSGYCTTVIKKRTSTVYSSHH